MDLRKKFFPPRAVRDRRRPPRKAVDAPSPAEPKARLGGIRWALCPFQVKPFCGSTEMV